MSSIKRICKNNRSFESLVQNVKRLSIYTILRILSYFVVTIQFVGLTNDITIRYLKKKTTHKERSESEGRLLLYPLWTIKKTDLYGTFKNFYPRKVQFLWRTMKVIVYKTQCIFEIPLETCKDIIDNYSKRKYVKVTISIDIPNKDVRNRVSNLFMNQYNLKYRKIWNSEEIIANVTNDSLYKPFFD